MSRSLGFNSYGNMAVGIADRQHVNPMLEGILACTDRKTQVQVLRDESRRSSTSTSPASTTDTSSLLSSHSTEKRRKSKSSFWSVRSNTRNLTPTMGSTPTKRLL